MPHAATYGHDPEATQAYRQVEHMLARSKRAMSAVRPTTQVPRPPACGALAHATKEASLAGIRSARQETDHPSSGRCSLRSKKLLPTSVLLHARMTIPLLRQGSP